MRRSRFLRRIAEAVTLVFLAALGGCGGRESAHKSVSQWVDELKAAYISDGIRGFDAARNSMIANEKLLPDDLDHDTAAMVLGLGETGSTKKEAKLTAQLQSLAMFIETHPGRARAEQEELEGKLFSYSFGNGPIDYDSVPAKLADLYFIIANGKDARPETN